MPFDPNLDQHAGQKNDQHAGQQGDQSNSSQLPVATDAGMMHLIVNGQALTLPVGTTVADVLVSQAVRTELVVVEVNMEIVSKARHAHTVLKSGDQIEVVTLVGGG